MAKFGSVETTVNGGMVTIKIKVDYEACKKAWYGAAKKSSNYTASDFDAAMESWDFTKEGEAFHGCFDYTDSGPSYIDLGPRHEVTRDSLVMQEEYGDEKDARKYATDIHAAIEKVLNKGPF